MHARPPGRPGPPVPRGRPMPPGLPTQRLFIGVPLDSNALRAVAGLVADLRADEAAARSAGAGAHGRSGIRWVRPEGVHLTLRFLGPTHPALVAAAASALEAAAAGVGAFTVRIAGGGAFPRQSAPRVLWLGVGQGAERLADLAGRLEAKLAEAGWPPEGRPFSAHLTLARADDVVAARPVADALVRRAAALEIGWTADRAILFESRTGPGGARYEPLRVVPLVG